MESLICCDIVSHSEINQDIEDLISSTVSLNVKEEKSNLEDHAITVTPRGDLKYYIYVQIDSTNEDKLDSFFQLIKNFQTLLNLKGEPNMIYVNCEEKYLEKIRKYKIGNMYSALNTNSNFKWTHRALLGARKCKLINLKAVQYDSQWLFDSVSKLESYQSPFFDLETYDPTDFI